MKLRIAAIALGATVVSAVPATAQAPITGVKATFSEGYVPPDGGVTTDGYYVGPYTGTLKIGSVTTPVTFYCVDFFHDVTNSESWTGTLTNVGSGDGIGTTAANSTTRLYGSVTVSGMTFTADQVYKAAAYLAATYPTPASSNPSATIYTQDLIWEMTALFYPQSGESSYWGSVSYSGGLPTYTRSDGYKFTGPDNAAQLANLIETDSNIAGFDYGNWSVLTTTDVDSKSGPQEFLVSPEPGTFALFGSGLFGIIGSGFVRRRRRGVALSA